MCETGDGKRVCPGRYTSSACEKDGKSSSKRLIMSPPPYADLGKQARGVFNNGYHVGLIKLDVNTTANSGVSVSTNGTSNQTTGKTSGSLETKYKVKEHGLTFSEKWTTDNTLVTGISVTDKGVKGLTVSTDLNFSPNTGEKSGKLKTAFQNERVAVNLDSDLSNRPILGASLVVQHQGWLAGYQTAFSTENSKLTKNNFALGFSTADFILHTNVDHSDDGQEFGGSIYQKLSPKLETGIMLAWSAGSNATKFGVAAKYDLDQDASIRAKVNNQSQIGLSYQQRLREGVTLTLSALIDGQNNSGHQVGMALELSS